MFLYDHIYTVVLWVLGSVFILTVFEPAEETPPRNLVLLALFWPIYTIFMVIYDFFVPYQD